VAFINLMHGFVQVFQPFNMLVLFIGLLVGMAVSIMPGLGLVVGVVHRADFVDGSAQRELPHLSLHFEESRRERRPDSGDHQTGRHTGTEQFVGVQDSQLGVFVRSSIRIDAG